LGVSFFLSIYLSSFLSFLSSLFVLWSLASYNLFSVWQACSTKYCLPVLKGIYDNYNHHIECHKSPVRWICLYKDTWCSGLPFWQNYLTKQQDKPEDLLHCMWQLWVSFS
jgi:hypothetical protein